MLTRGRLRARIDSVLKERATALVLLPAMMLVFITLGAIALDMSAIAGAQRAAERDLAAAADDAAAMLDARAHQQDGSIRIDPRRAAAVVEARVEASDGPGRVRDLRVEVTDTVIEVSARVESPHLFLRAVPGMADRSLSAPVRVRARLQP